MSETAPLKPLVKVSLVGDSQTPVLNFEIERLLIGIRELGSLNAAAHTCGIAYSRAWRLIKNAESELGGTLIDRNGVYGSTLTAQGEQLLDAYAFLRARIEAFAAEQTSLALAQFSLHAQ